MFSSTNGDLEKIRGDLGQLLRQQEEMKTKLAGLSDMKDQMAELSSGQGVLRSMLEDICEYHGLEKRRRQERRSSGDVAGSGGRQDTVLSGMTGVSGTSDAKPSGSPKVKFEEPEHGARGSAKNSDDAVLKSMTSSSSILTSVSHKSSHDSVSDVDEQSGSDSDEDDTGTASERLAKKKKSMVRMRQHESWERSKTPNRRFVALGFDIFSSSTHTDWHDEKTLAKREGPRPAQLVVKEFRRFCGTIPHPRTWDPQRLVMSPSSKFTLFWTMLEGLLLMSDFIMIPMTMFDDADVRTFGVSPWSDISLVQRWVSIVFWSLDFPMSFFKGYIDNNGERVLRPKKVALKYVVSGAPLDIPLLVIEHVTFFLANSFSEGRVLRVLRYSRSLKAGKLRRLTRRLLARVKRPEALALMYMLGHLFAVVMMCHVFGCLWYGIGTLVDVGPISWTDKFFDHSDGTETYPPNSDNHAFRYFTSLRWALAQLGFGDSQIYPQNWLESLFAVFFSVICVITMTHLIGLIITSMIRLQDGKREVTAQEADMREYLRQHEVSYDLQDRIWQVLREVQGDAHRTKEENVDLIKQLPNSLEIELRAEVFVPTLTCHPFFGVYGVSGADPHAMYNIIRKQACAVRQLEAKQELFSEHEEARHMWWVVQGALSYRYKHEPLEVNSKEWIGEAALWLQWRYVGTAVAKISSDLVELDGNAFREIVQADLPQAQRYAKAMFQYAVKNCRRFHDMMPDRVPAHVMAKDIFAPASAFSLKECVPLQKRRLDEWKPAAEDWQDNWTSPWSDSHSLSSSALISTMMTEMKRDVIMVFQTLFSQNLAEKSIYNWPSDTEKDHYEKRVLFLKRLIIMLGMCHVSCTDDDNSTELQPWPYPLASVICHGGRCMLRLQGVQPKEVINWLMLGDKDGNNWERTGVPPGPMYTRLAASHSVKVDATGHLNELKVKGVAGASGRGHNLGMDLPLGGLGNPTPKHPSGSMLVGPAGVPYKQKGQDCVHVKDFQHGHLYLRWDDFGTRSVKHLLVQPSPQAQASASPVSPDVPVPLSPTPAPMLPMQRRGSVGSILSMEDDDEDPTDTLETVFVAELAAQIFGSKPKPDASSSGDLFMSRPPLNQKIEKIEDLEAHLPDMAGSDVKTDLLFRYSIDRKELMLNQDSRGRVNGCRGVMVHLTIEMEGSNGEDLVLAHLGAAPPDSAGVVTMNARKTEAGSSLTTPQPGPGGRVAAKGGAGKRDGKLARGTSSIGGGSSSTLENIIPDCRVVSVLCRYDGLWLPTVMQYVQKQFQLGEAAMEKIYQGLSEEVQLGLSEPAPTVTHHHMSACGDSLSLEYDALYLKSKLYLKDANVLEKFISPQTGYTRITDDHVPVAGLGEGDERGEATDGITYIKREWVWMPKSEAEQRCVREMSPPRNAEPLKLESKDITLGSLLFGIENSAPLKEDLFGGTHGTSAKSKETSAFGRRKWRDFRKNGRVTGQPPAPVCLKVPAELGGVQMMMTRAKFEEVMTICEKIDFQKPSEARGGSQDHKEEEFFQKLLCCDASSSENLIHTYAIGNLQSNIMGHRPSLQSAVSSVETSHTDRYHGSKEPRPPSAFGVPRLLRNNSRSTG